MFFFSYREKNGKKKMSEHERARKEGQRWTFAPSTCTFLHFRAPRQISRCSLFRTLHFLAPFAFRSKIGIRNCSRGRGNMRRKADFKWTNPAVKGAGRLTPSVPIYYVRGLPDGCVSLKLDGAIVRTDSIVENRMRMEGERKRERERQKKREKRYRKA